MPKTISSLPLGVLAAAVLVVSATPAAAQFDDFFDFGSAAGKLNDLVEDEGIVNISAFEGNPFSVGYSPDSIDFGGSLVIADNSGVFLSLAQSEAAAFSGVDENFQRLQVDVNIGATNEAENLTVQLSDNLFGTGYAYDFDISRLDPGQHTLFSPVLSNGTPFGVTLGNPAGNPLDYNNDVIDQVSFFSGNFSSGVSQNVDFSVDSLSLFTPNPVDPGRLEFGPDLNQLSFQNGGLPGLVDNRGQFFGAGPTPALNDPESTPDGLRFSGTVPANSLNGQGVTLGEFEQVDFDPDERPLSPTDELVLEIVVGEGNEVRDLIFEIITTDFFGQNELYKTSWQYSGIQDLAPGTHILSDLTFADGTEDSLPGFDPTLGDLASKIVLFGFNAQNPDEPLAGDVTDKELDITIRSVSFGLEEVPGLSGDFNGDGIVDGADYTLWRDAFNTSETVLMGNGDGSGTVDQGDYDLWVDNFGATASLGAAIPEPATAVGALMILAGVAMGRRVA